MARFGDLEAAIMDVVWTAGAPVRVRAVSEQLNRDRPLAFNTVQTVMENLYRKGWLGRHKHIGFVGFLLLSLIITPVLSLIILMMAHDRRPRAVS